MLTAIISYNPGQYLIEVDLHTHKNGRLNKDHIRITEQFLKEDITQAGHSIVRLGNVTCEQATLLAAAAVALTNSDMRVITLTML